MALSTHERASAPGHLMAELAACRTSVGLTDVRHPALFELRGSVADLAAVAVALGDAPPGRTGCHRTAWGWWDARSPHRVLALADAQHRPQLASGLQMASASRRDVVVSDFSTSHRVIVLVGPRARALAASSLVRLSQAVLTVFDGDEYWVLVLPANRAREARVDLLEAARGFGIVAIGAETAELHRAARHVEHARPTSPARRRPPALSGHGR